MYALYIFPVAVPAVQYPNYSTCPINPLFSLRFTRGMWSIHLWKHQESIAVNGDLVTSPKNIWLKSNHLRIYSWRSYIS